VTVKTAAVTIPIIQAEALVIGTGAASLNAALHLKRGGADVIIVTEHPGWGTSANTGSDKQTYYRADPGNPGGDSYREMAQQLFSGGAMHGDIALVEASLSLYSFHHLVSIGVPFPSGTYGNHTGYRTDHDFKNRGVSAGPRTSIMMYRCLYEEVQRLNIPIYDRHEVIELLTDDKNVCIGAVVLSKDELSGDARGVMIFAAPCTVLGTGGPAALFGRSVYPHRQKGSLGIALKAGAAAQNLTESQFGIGSVKFRWNLSGSYQQVLPCYYSVDDEGKKYNFLDDYFSSSESMFLAQFQKGYMWPFDVAKCTNEASSIIDLLVFRETVHRGRKVFLDFRKNPTWRGETLDLEALPGEVYDYLKQSNALGLTPVERLKKMNDPAFELYLSNGFDLEKEPLEIAVNHQHCNGGLRGNIWWESSIHNLFPVGECNGSHGIYRPGGSALNAGQVGSLRAAKQILWRLKGGEEIKEVKASFLKDKGGAWITRIDKLLRASSKRNLTADRKAIRSRADRALGIMRTQDSLEEGLKENRTMAMAYRESGIKGIEELSYFLKNEDLLITEYAMLMAVKETMQKLKTGRGSWFVNLPEDIFSTPGSGLSSELQPIGDKEMLKSCVLESSIDEKGNLEHQWIMVRPIPDDEEWFEEVWARFRKGSVYTEE